MPKEKQKLDEEPKKKRGKKPLIIGGALAAAAVGYLALAPKTDQTKAEQDATRAKVTQMLPDAGARIAAAKKLAENSKPPLSKEEEIKERLRREIEEMRNGNILSAKDVYSSIPYLVHDEGDEEGITNGNTQKAALKKVLDELGLTEEEYYTAGYASQLQLEDLEYFFNLPRDIEYDEYIVKKLWDRLDVLYGQETSGGGYRNPLFLRLLKIDEQTLQDKLTEILTITEGTKGPYDEGPNRELRERLRKAYGIQ